MFPAVLCVITLTDVSTRVDHESVGIKYKTVSERSATTWHTHPYEYTSVLIMAFAPSPPSIPVAPPYSIGHQ
jgi:hypothetical protein